MVQVCFSGASQIAYLSLLKWNPRLRWAPSCRFLRRRNQSSFFSLTRPSLSCFSYHALLDICQRLSTISKRLEHTPPLLIQHHLSCVWLRIHTMRYWQLRLSPNSGCGRCTKVNLSLSVTAHIDWLFTWWNQIIQCNYNYYTHQLHPKMTSFRISILWLALGSSSSLIVSVTKCMFSQVCPIKAFRQY